MTSDSHKEDSSIQSLESLSYFHDLSESFMTRQQEQLLSLRRWRRSMDHCGELRAKARSSEMIGADSFLLVIIIHVVT